MESNTNNQLESEKINNALDWNEIDPLPLNEFKIDRFATLAFDKLFPLGNADPTQKCRYF